MRLLRICTFTSLISLGFFYFIGWLIIPLFFQEPSMNTPLTKLLYFRSLNKESLEVMKYLVFTDVMIIFIALISFIGQLILKIKYKKMDKWLIINTLFLLIALPSIIPAVIIFFTRVL